MSNPAPTPDQVLAALSTPPRDMRDEIWLRVYAQNFTGYVAAPAEELDAVAAEAAVLADAAVARMPIPAHRRAEVGLS